MTNEQKIKQLTTIAKYAMIKLDENGHYSAGIQVHIALMDTLSGRPISNNLERIIKSYLTGEPI